jgi:hypothetical protein
MPLTNAAALFLGRPVERFNAVAPADPVSAAFGAGDAVSAAFGAAAPTTDRVAEAFNAGPTVGKAHVKTDRVAEAFKAPSGPPSDPVTALFTSGTTARPAHAPMSAPDPLDNLTELDETEEE